MTGLAVEATMKSLSTFKESIEREIKNEIEIARRTNSKL